MASERRIEMQRYTRETARNRRIYLGVMTGILCVSWAVFAVGSAHYHWPVWSRGAVTLLYAAGVVATWTEPAPVQSHRRNRRRT